eukprot:m.517663 g.517663  ORF g.517663 m.517663 type:complete len:80 (+) comp21935_c0_seq51:42-281(+)
MTHLHPNSLCACTDAPPNGTDITVDFASLGLRVPAGCHVRVLDIWTGQPLEEHYNSSYTAKNVSQHGTSFLRFSTQPQP